MFGKSVLQIDPERETARIVATMREQVLAVLRRRGAVLGLSGGIDSSVCAALAVRAFGADKVLALFMPERDSADESLIFGRDVAALLGINTVVQNIAPVLEAAGCYRSQLEAIQSVVPEYGEGYRFKLVLPSILEGDRLNVTRLTVESPGGDVRTVRLPHAAYLQIVAATNYKQRVRKMTEYYHADRTNFAVIGTPNRLEYDQGFFVKQGDGAADLKPIAHLYKTQVYALAEYLEVPAAIRARPPTTDTFSMPQTQEEFFFALPYPAMDLCLYAFNNGVPAPEVAAALELTEAQVERVFKDIEAKRRATRYLHEPPMLVEPVLQG